MRIADNIAKISWSFFDKVVFALYALVLFFLVKYIPMSEFGLFAIYTAVINWFFTVADAYCLQGIIRFAGNAERNKQINYISFSYYWKALLSGLGLWLIYYLLSETVGFSASPPISSPRLDLGVYELVFFIPILILVNSPRMYLIKIFLRELRYDYITICNVILYGAFVAFLLFDINAGIPIVVNNLLLYFSISTLLSSVFCIIVGVKYVTFGDASDSDFYKKYSLPVSLQSLLNTSVRQLDILLLSVFTGKEGAGVYQLAKSIFKFFEEAGMAAASIYNPAIVRQLARVDSTTLANSPSGTKSNQMITPLLEKVYSYMFLLFFVALVAVWSGLLEYTLSVVFDNENINSAVDILYVMTLAGLFLPLFVISFIFNAVGMERKFLIYNAVAVAVASAIFIIFGSTEDLALYSLGLVTYYAIIASFTYNYIRKEYGFKLMSISRVVRDIKGLIKGR